MGFGFIIREERLFFFWIIYLGTLYTIYGRAKGGMSESKTGNRKSEIGKRKWNWWESYFSQGAEMEKLAWRISETNFMSMDVFPYSFFHFLDWETRSQDITITYHHPLS